MVNTEDYIQDLGARFAQVPRPDEARVDLLEVCRPSDSGLGQAVLDRGGMIARVGLHNFDLSTCEGAKGARNLAMEFRP